MDDIHTLRVKSYENSEERIHGCFPFCCVICMRAHGRATSVCWQATARQHVCAGCGRAHRAQAPAPRGSPIRTPQHRPRTITLSVRNRTFHRWRVHVHGSKTTDARLSSLSFEPMTVEPNDDTSCTVVRLIQNEGLRINRVEASTARPRRGIIRNVPANGDAELLPQTSRDLSVPIVLLSASGPLYHEASLRSI